jgi:succinate dehydrogenase/fumarate reductase cytochrome b subunit
LFYSCPCLVVAYVEYSNEFVRFLLFFIFRFKSQYTSLFFSFFIVTALSALLYHLLSATRYLFWTSEAGMQNDVFNLRDLRQTQSYFLLIPVVLVVLSWVVFMLI